MGKHSMTLYRLLTEVFVLLDDADRRLLSQHNLSIRQFNILYHLDQGQGLSINELSHRLLCDKSNTTRLVERMKQEGLVIREQDTKDRRYVSVYLTEKGARLREEAVALHWANVKNLLEVLSSEEKTTLNQLLARLRDGLREQLDSAK